MQANFDLLKATRELLLSTIKGLSLEALNEIPDNFSNNIIWNVGHILVTQQLLHYNLSKLEPRVSKDWINKFRKGTTPVSSIDSKEWQEILTALKELPEILEKDYHQNLFTSFDEYPTSYGYILHNIDEAILFNNAHEALHLGYIMSLKKSL